MGKRSRRNTDSGAPAFTYRAIVTAPSEGDEDISMRVHDEAHRQAVSNWKVRNPGTSYDEFPILNYWAEER